MKKIILLLSISFFIAGCGSLPFKKHAGEARDITLTTAGTLRFDDVPVPAGFKLLHKESFIFQNDYTRLGFIKYAGRAKDSDVVRFYKEKMPANGWQLINSIEYGKKILNFEKAQETCAISIEPATFKTTLLITVSPKSPKVEN